MIDYSLLLGDMDATCLRGWRKELDERLDRVLRDTSHGDLPAWLDIVSRLPRLNPGQVELGRACISVGDASSASERQKGRIRELLQGLHPWRKGPFRVHGVYVDAEWRCDRKWERVRRVIAPLRDRLILDVGCGNGYYAWRMVGEGARLVVGIDPSLRFVFQYQALRHFLGDHPAYVLPMALEDLPGGPECFDTVFSMGVFHHRRSPFDHLSRLLECLRPGGELLLETLVAGCGEGRVLVPRDRYARMRNVWFIPSPETLVGWLERAGFRNARVEDVTPTSTDEQRSTPWMRFHSLTDFLDPGEGGRTVEGLPAPVRGIFVANRPA